MRQAPQDTDTLSPMPTVPVTSEPRPGAPLLSVVLPMKNEAQGLDRLFARLLPALARLGAGYEIVAVDDGSTDDTFMRLKALSAADPAVKAVSLSRNFGKEVAIYAGLAHTRGAAVVVMDADLQHPPEAIESLVGRWREGFPVVYARRGNLAHRGARRWLSRAFYGIFGVISDVELDAAGGDFMLLDRRVVDAFLRMGERNRFTRGLIAWAGFRSAIVDVEIEARTAGGSQFSLRKLASLGLNAITAFGVLPLRVWTYMGGILSLISIAVAFYFFVKTVLFGTDVPGYPSIIIALFFTAGVQLMGLGIIGEYLGRVFTEVKGRPLYLVQERVGFDDSHAADHSHAPHPDRLSAA